MWSRRRCRSCLGERRALRGQHRSAEEQNEALLTTSRSSSRFERKTLLRVVPLRLIGTVLRCGRSSVLSVRQWPAPVLS